MRPLLSSHARYTAAVTSSVTQNSGHQLWHAWIGYDGGMGEIEHAMCRECNHHDPEWLVGCKGLLAGAPDNEHEPRCPRQPDCCELGAALDVVDERWNLGGRGPLASSFVAANRRRHTRHRAEEAPTLHRGA